MIGFLLTEITTNSFLTPFIIFLLPLVRRYSFFLVVATSRKIKGLNCLVLTLDLKVFTIYVNVSNGK